MLPGDDRDMADLDRGWEDRPTQAELHDLELYYRRHAGYLSEHPVQAQIRTDDFLPVARVRGEAGHHHPLTAATLAALLLIVVVFWTFPLAFLSVLGRVPLELLCALPVVFFLVAVAFALCVSAGQGDEQMRRALERVTRAETDER